MAQDRIAASPQSPVLGALARHLRAARSFGDEARIPLIDMGLGELLLGKAPEEIEEWSYGNLPFQQGREGIGSRIPQLKRGRAEGVMDAMTGALDAAGVGAFARRGITAAVGSAGTRFGASPIPQIGAIKPRGGNWLTGSVEGALGGLRKYSDDNEMEMFRGLASNREKELMDLNQQRAATLDKLRAEGQPDSVINLVDAEFTRKIDQANQLLSGNLAEIAKLDRNASLNRWIEGPLTKYIKRDMATPEDPVRRLAEEGIVHYSPEIDVNSPTLRELRSSAGFPPEGLGRSEAAKQWEAMSDMQPIVQMGRDFPDGIASFMDEETLTDNPWLTKLGPDDNVYSLNKRYPPNQALGFDHLVDELSNAMDPGSGLPRNLLLRPEQMRQMGVEKAVRHVDAINKWRAAQQTAANAELANKAMVLREYPDTPEMPNPKGLRWMELKAKDVNPPDGYEYDKRTGMYIDPWDEASQPWTPKQDRKAAEEELEKQLKYEGDTMGHCVGGYCPDVIEGRSRIFSLRDTKGEPHVTVEVKPAEEWVKRPGAVDENPIIKNEWPEFYRDLVRRVNGNPSPEDIATFKDYMLSKYPDNQSVASFFGPAFKIQQIKGKQNLAPKDDYLPFVQDFVRNSPLGGSWADVGDLRYTGLRKVGDKYVTLDELKNVPRDELGLPIDYQPLDDLPDWKDGGLVDGGIDDPVQFALQWRELVDAENGYRRA